MLVLRSNRLYKTLDRLRPFCYFYPNFWDNTQLSRVVLVKIDPIGGITSQSIAEEHCLFSDSFVSIACSPGDVINLAWQRDTAIMCATVINDMLVRLEIVSAVASQHPFIDGYGQHVRIVWRDRASGVILMKERTLPDLSWQTACMVDAGDFPSVSKCAAFAYENPLPVSPPSQDEIWARVLGGTVYNLSESWTASEYAHLDAVSFVSGAEPLVDTIFSIWSEKIGTSLYRLDYRLLSLQQGPGDGGMAGTKTGLALARRLEAGPNPSRGPMTLRY